jgi:succinate dehydrogenase / fumarate reductase flavoprotein subunit
MARTAEGLRKAIAEIQTLRQEFSAGIKVTGKGEELNQELEKAGRVADFFEFAELMCHDALTREESCGGHFRVEHATPEGEALRDDENFQHVTAWEFTGVGNEPAERREPLTFDYVHPTARSYK